MRNFSTFTSESVSEAHPDKVCDQISDAILDAAFRADKASRVAVECLIKENTLVVAGELTTRANLGYEEIKNTAVDVLKKVGYNRENGFDTDGFTLISRLTGQSGEIGKAVDNTNGSPEESNFGAGDQGMMFGYASMDTESFEGMQGMYMPAPIAFAHALMRKHAEVRESELGELRPDAKCQLSFQYDNGQPSNIATIVLSTQHDSSYTDERGQLKEGIPEVIKEKIIYPVIPEGLRKKTRYFINPSGAWEAGGPQVDCGLTGRKIIVDTYGGAALHGGGALSGKDPTKVDRSAAYAARHAAKNVVAAGLARECEIQVSYAIGEPYPTSVAVNTFGTHSPDISQDRLAEAIEKVFDFSVRGIIDQLNLREQEYLPTAAFGHFGRNNGEFSWERTDKIEELKAAIKDA